MVFIGLNGFNRIARNFLRMICDDSAAVAKVTIAVINIGPADAEYAAHIFKYDALLGTYPGIVKVEGDFLVINTYKIRLCAYADVTKIDWVGYGVNWVVETAGICKTTKDFKKFGGARVLVAYPCLAAEATCLVDDMPTQYVAQQSVSLGSCVDNAVMPLIKIIDGVCGVLGGTVTVLYAHTNDHMIDYTGTSLHTYSSDSTGVTEVEQQVGVAQLRRSPALNIIPFGGQRMGPVYLSLFSLPLERVSFVDFTLFVGKSITVGSLSKELRSFDFIEYSQNSIVSSDVIDNPHPLVLDGSLIHSAENMIKIFGWYDNQSAYAAYIKDFLLQNVHFQASALDPANLLQK